MSCNFLRRWQFHTSNKLSCPPNYIFEGIDGVGYEAMALKRGGGKGGATHSNVEPSSPPHPPKVLAPAFLPCGAPKNLFWAYGMG